LNETSLHSKLRLLIKAASHTISNPRLAIAQTREQNSRLANVALVE